MHSPNEDKALPLEVNNSYRQTYRHDFFQNAKGSGVTFKGNCNKKTVYLI